MEENEKFKDSRLRYEEWEWPMKNELITRNLKNELNELLLQLEFCNIFNHTHINIY